MSDLSRLMVMVEDLQSDLTEVKRDVKELREAGLFRRVDTLEGWRNGLSTRLWTFTIGCGIASLSAWLAVLVSSGQ